VAIEPPPAPKSRVSAAYTADVALSEASSGQLAQNVNKRATLRKIRP